MNRKLLGLLVSASAITLSAGAQVQAGLGAFAGVVTDSTKATIPGARVVLTNPSTGLRLETLTNSSGEYTFPGLIVGGGYTITISRPGFATVTLKNLSDSVGTITTQSASLPLGSDQTVIEVQGLSSEQVQTDTSSVSQLIDATVFNESPLLIRNQNTFVGLVAGAAPDTANTGRGYAVNGARTGAGNFLLDGFDNNDQGLGGGAAGGAVVTISPDAIQEYRVITSVPNAEYGRAGGFTTDTVLKSGTNNFHGSAFEYNRSQFLAQNGFFSNRSGLRNHLVFNQFGGSVGGPIYKDKTFFYATAEFYRRSLGAAQTYTGITQDFYNFVKSGAYQAFMEGTAQQNATVRADGTVGLGFCPQYLGRTCPGAFASVASTGPVFNANYGATPQEFPFGTQNLSDEPTDLLLGGTTYLPVNIYGTGNIIQSTKEIENRGTLKLDHKLTNRDQLAFTYSIDQDGVASNIGGGDTTPGPAYLSPGGAQIFGASYTRIFTPNLINVFKAGYLRHVRNFQASGPLGVSSTYAADSLGTGFGATAGFPQLFTENQFAYEDAVTVTRGRNTIKGGFRFQRTRNGSSFYNDVNGTQIFWGAPGLLTDGLNEVAGETVDPADFGAPTGATATLGSLYYASASLDPTTGKAPDPYRGYRANEFSGYGQDDFKATPHLVFNVGLRWDYFGPPHNAVAGVDSNVYFGSATSLTPTGNPFLPNTPIAIGEQGATFQYAQSHGRSTIWDRDLNNFAPRFGFSYDTFGNGKFVMRGGYGIGFDRLYNNVFENIRFNGPRFVDNAYGVGAGNGVIDSTLRAGLVKSPFVGNNLLAAAGASPVPRHVTEHLKTAYYEQYHFGFETQAKGYVMEVNYIGTLGRQLVGLMNANTFEGRTACSTVAAAGKAPTTQQALCLAAGYTTALSTKRETSIFGNDNFRTNGFSSNYNAGQVSLRKGYSHGLQLSANYTYGKAMDQISDVFTLKGGGTGIPTPYNAAHNYGPADFDVRHNAVVTMNYQSQSATHKLLLAGWGFSPIVTLRSGTPINLKDSLSTYDPNKDGTLGVERAYYYGTGKGNSQFNHNVSPAGTTAANSGALSNANKLFRPYTCPLNVNNGLFCDVPGRNQLTGLRYYNVDAQISKHLHFGERFQLTLQAAFFNLDGHTQFLDPSADLNSTNFGKSTATYGGAGRNGQLSGRFEF